VLLVDLKKGLPYTLISKKPCNFVQFNKNFILNKFSVLKDSLSVFIFSHDRGQTHLEEFQYGEQFMKALKLLAEEE